MANPLPQSMDDLRLMRRPEVEAVCGASRSLLYDMVPRKLPPAAEPVTLRDALGTWSDRSLADHTQVVREAAKGYAGVRLTCADHPPSRKTCSHCRDAKKLLDRGFRLL